MIHQERLIYHPSLAGRGVTLFLFTRYLPRRSILLNLSRERERDACVCARARARNVGYVCTFFELFHSLNPLGAAANAVACSGDSSVPATRDGFNTPGREKSLPYPTTTILCPTLRISFIPSRIPERSPVLSTLLSCAVVLTDSISTR